MKKKIFYSVSAALLVTTAAAFVYANNKSSDDDFWNRNAEALANGEGGYSCPGACLTWTGSTGGGIDCMCHRYVGKCKKWCD